MLRHILILKSRQRFERYRIVVFRIGIAQGPIEVKNTEGGRNIKVSNIIVIYTRLETLFIVNKVNIFVSIR